MLTTTATPNTVVGTGRVNPSERPSAVAQTASRTPDPISTIHASTTHHSSAPSCRWPGTAPLVRCRLRAHPFSPARGSTSRPGFPRVTRMTDADREHPSIARFRAELAARGGTGEIRVLPDSVHTAALAAQALGCEVGAIANSLLFDAGGEPVLILTSG